MLVADVGARVGPIDDEFDLPAPPDGKLGERVAERFVTAGQHAEAAGDFFAVQLQRGRLIMAGDSPGARRALELVGRHEAAVDALKTVAAAADDLEVDPLLAFFLEKPRRHVDGDRAGAVFDVQNLHAEIVDEHRQLIVFALEAIRREPLADRQHGRAGRFFRAPAMTRAMGHQPIDQLFGLRSAGRNFLHGQGVQRTQFDRSVTPGQYLAAGLGVGQRHVEIALGENFQQVGRPFLAVHLGKGQRQMGHRGAR